MNFGGTESKIRNMVHARFFFLKRVNDEHYAAVLPEISRNENGFDVFRWCE